MKFGHNIAIFRIMKEGVAVPSGRSDPFSIRRPVYTLHIILVRITYPKWRSGTRNIPHWYRPRQNTFFLNYKNGITKIDFERTKKPVFRTKKPVDCNGNIPVGTTASQFESIGRKFDSFLKFFWISLKYRLSLWSWGVSTRRRTRRRPAWPINRFSRLRSPRFLSHDLLFNMVDMTFSCVAKSNQRSPTMGIDIPRTCLVKSYA